MEYRRLGKTGWRVSTISMGCWGIGGQWGPVAEAEAIRTVHAALDLGVNLFDTADAYGSGVSEELVGRALRGRRDGVYIATKVGNFGRRQDAPLSYTSPLHIELCCDASLGRMKIDAIDLYQCHIGDLPDPSIFLEAFERLVERGKVRAYGVSTNSLAVARAFNRAGGCAAVQLNFSLLNRSAELDLLPWCAANDIGTLLRGPIAPGYIDVSETPEEQARYDAEDGGAAPWIVARRTARPDEIAEVALFLASDAASYVTGQTLFADGGLLLPAVTTADYLRGDRAGRGFSG